MGDRCDNFPYDCTSEKACNAWLAAHPNPPCPTKVPCYFCNANFPSNIGAVSLLPEVCLDQGGFIDLALAQEACKPTPPDVQCGTVTFACASNSPGDPTETNGYWENTGIQDTAGCNDCPNGFYIDGVPNVPCNSTNFNAFVEVALRCKPSRSAENPLP